MCLTACFCEHDDVESSDLHACESSTLSKEPSPRVLLPCISGLTLLHFTLIYSEKVKQSTVFSTQIQCSFKWKSK